MIFKKFLSSTVVKSREERDAELYRALIRREAKIGGEIFGATAPGVRREFFCLDERTWIWHEEWTDEKGQLQIRTTRYDVRPDGILKAQDGQNYQKVSRSEAKRLVEAIQLYGERVNRELYAAYTN